MADSKKLAGYVTFTHPDGGTSQTFGPDDKLPDWAAEQARDEHYESEPTDADLPVAGPGQVAGEGMSDEDKEKARKAAEAERKRNARALAKQQADNEAAVKAAQEAEAKRQEELAKQQGGGS